MILSNYQKIYKNYCISYFGDNFIYPIILSNLRKHFEKLHSDLNVFFCYNNIIYEKFKNKKNVINKNFIENERSFFGYVYNIKENLIESPIEDLINDEDFKFHFEKKEQNTKKCLLIKKNNNNILSFLEIEKIKNKITKNGYELVDNVKNINEIGAVAGLESPEIFSAAFYGIPTFLLESKSININVYKKLFPNQEILN